MQEQLISTAAKEGLFALLFVGLLWWVLRESSRREDKLIEESKRRIICIIICWTTVVGFKRIFTQRR